MECASAWFCSTTETFSLMHVTREPLRAWVVPQRYGIRVRAGMGAEVLDACASGLMHVAHHGKAEVLGSRRGKKTGTATLIAEVLGMKSGGRGRPRGRVQPISQCPALRFGDGLARRCVSSGGTSVQKAGLLIDCSGWRITSPGGRAVAAAGFEPESCLIAEPDPHFSPHKSLAFIGGVPPV